MTHAEDRHKLVLASISFYKTIEQVCTVLTSLQGDYKRDDDYCGFPQHEAAIAKERTKLLASLGGNNGSGGVDASGNNNGQDEEHAINMLISKHQDQKEAFLKACTLARRNAENFLKYISRCIQYCSSPRDYTAPGQATYQAAEARLKSIMDDLRHQEATVLQSWSEKKRRLDQCNQYVLVEHSSRQALKWIGDTGNVFLHSSPKEKEFGDFSHQLVKRKEKVALLGQLAYNMLDKGHSHEVGIRRWMTFVEQSYNEFCQQFERAQASLTERYRVAESSVASARLDMISNTSTITSASNSISSFSDDSSSRTTTGMMVESNRKSSIKKMDYSMAELLKTERDYVDDLKLCIDTYLYEFRHSPSIPIGLVGKEKVLFSNIEQIYEFHNK